MNALVMTMAAFLIVYGVLVVVLTAPIWGAIWLLYTWAMQSQRAALIETKRRTD